MGDLRERDAELAVLAGVLADAAAGRGRVAIVEGEAGIGKTALLQATVAGAAAAGADAVVLRARGGELERDFGFGIVRQLFEPVLRRADPPRRAALLDGAAAAAGPVLGAGPPGRPVDGYAVQHGLYWLLDTLATESPVVLVVDDAQWADTASLRWLVHSARRLDGVAAAMLIGLRSGDPGADGATVEALRAEPVSVTVPLAALSEAAGSAIARHILGPTASDELCRACHGAGGGNPFLLEQPLTEVSAADAPGSVDRVGPAEVRRSVRRRLAGLPPEAAALARAVAVLGAGAHPPVAAALAGLPPGDMVDAAEALQKAGLLISSGAAALQFPHPVLRSAVYTDLSDARRVALHVAAARLLVDDPERAAAHLLAAPPVGEAWAGDTLRGAARRALDRSTPDLAADLLDRALAEPARARAEVLLECGHAERRAGRPGAFGHLREGLDTATDPALRERLLTELVYALGWSDGPQEAVRRLDAELARTDGADRPRVLRLEAMRLIMTSNSMLPHRPDGVAALRALPGTTDDERRGLTAVLAHHLVQCDVPVAELEPLVTRTWAGGRPARDIAATPCAYPILTCIALDDLDRASSIAEHVLSAGRAAGDAPVVGTATSLRGWIALFRGDLRAAEADLRVGLPGPSSEYWRGRAFGLAYLVHTLVHRGDPDGAEDALAVHGVADGDLPRTTQGRSLLLARATVHLARGRLRAAQEHIAEYQDRFRSRGSRGWPFGGRLVGAEAHRRDGDIDTARAYVEEELAAARDLGYRSAEGAALRAAGALENDLGLLAESVALLEALPRRLELAYSLVELGSALRRARRPQPARDALRRGLDLAHRCGAAPLAERARAELLAAGGRPRRLALTGVEALTATERRVATLAAAGASNPHIAQELFVTRKTVEAHLAATYRKLGVSSRADLPQILRVAPG